jgi:hypothetical protein
MDEAEWLACTVHYVRIAHRFLERPIWISLAGLLRDTVGNPFRPVVLSPAVLAWNAGTVYHIAQAIYEERAFDHLPILADDLEEAGCTNPDVLNHCRQPGLHIRGCWVVDLVLGKA